MARTLDTDPPVGPATTIRFRNICAKIGRDDAGKEFVEFTVPCREMPPGFLDGLNSMGLTAYQVDDVVDQVTEMNAMNLLLEHRSKT